MIILLYVSVIVFLIVFPAETADTARQALAIWATCIVPILFPYMVFSRLLCKKLSTLNLPAFPITAILGMLGGSPSGAAVIAANAHSLSERSLFTLCALTGTVSPMFILGSIQTWVDNPSITHHLLLCHWLSSVLCAWAIWLAYRSKQAKKTQRTENRFDNSSDPIKQSIDAVFHIGGCVILYSVLAGMLGKILYAFPVARSLCHALLEVSGGVHAICQTLLSPEAKYILIAAALGVNGLSILSQNYTVLQPLGVPMLQLVWFAIFRAILSAVIMACMTVWLPIS